MNKNLEEDFRKLEQEGAIKGEYLSIDKYFELKQALAPETPETKVPNKEDRQAFLEEIFKIRTENFKNEHHTINSWISNYLLAKEYYKLYGHLSPSAGEVYENYGIKLKIDIWVARQRVRHKSGQLRSKQIELLNEIGMDLEIKRSLSNYIDNENKENKEKEKSA